MECCTNPNCGESVPDSTPHCLVCGGFLGYPNVRAAVREKKELAERYERARDEADRRAASAQIKAFETAVRSSRAVMNVDLRFLYTFLSDDRALYASYWRQVEAEVRQAAITEFDRRRRTVDSAMFGEYASNIRFAALTMDGAGLSSYGPYALQLRDIATADRASLLEENSFIFVERHNVLSTNIIPTGYRASWHDRHKLAVAKLANKITAATSASEFAALLLASTGDRSNDDFIEVHIYGPFSARAIETVKGPDKLKSRLDNAMLAEVKELLQRKNIAWSEEW